MSIRVRFGLLHAAIAAVMVSAVAHAGPPQADYQWSNVAMGGGGAVPDIVLHPKVPNLAYIHTDVGGCYRWEESTGRWIPLLDDLKFTDWNLYGVDSLAVDPSDVTGNIVYISTGKYVLNWAKPVGMLMKSTDRGEHWTRLPLSPTGGSNQDQGCGERLSVDPNNGQHLLYGARSGGLSCSWDGGTSWSHVDSAPSGGQSENHDKSKRGNGITFTLFDAKSGMLENPHRTRVVYVGASSDGVYRSDDGGLTWHILSGGPRSQNRGVVGSDGMVVVSSASGLWKLRDNAWSQINPPGKPGGIAVAVDPKDSQHILATVGYSHYAGVFASIDGGNTWRDIRGERSPTVAWWPKWHWFSCPFSMVFDPMDQHHVWATDWYGTYHTDDIDADPVVWTNRVAGDEEICAIGALLSPHEGKYRLLSGAADVGGFDHEKPGEMPTGNIWSKHITDGMARTGIAESAVNPRFFASVFTKDWNGPGTGAYSLDGADTWTVFATLPIAGIKGGRVILPGKGQRILWVPQKDPPFFTDDLGRSWQPVQCDAKLDGTARGDGIFSYDQPVAIDGGDPNRVYLFSRRRLFLSTNAGKTFAVVNQKPVNADDIKLVASTRANELWIAADDKGLLRSIDGGKSFLTLKNVKSAKLIGLGKAKDVTAPATLFILGSVDGADGYFRSTDNGSSWSQIDIIGERIGNDPDTMTGDWQVFGGVFVGTNGRGMFYGRPKE